jgi:hypothetical protein
VAAAKDHDVETQVMRAGRQVFDKEQSCTAGLQCCTQEITQRLGILNVAAARAGLACSMRAPDMDPLPSMTSTSSRALGAGAAPQAGATPGAGFAPGWASSVWGMNVASATDLTTVAPEPPGAGREHS